jgi:hypothetical protein
MAANANVTQFIEDVGVVGPALVTQITNVLNLILQSPVLIILLSIVFVTIGYRIGMGIYRKMRR